MPKKSISFIGGKDSHFHLLPATEAIKKKESCASINIHTGTCLYTHKCAFTHRAKISLCGEEKAPITVL